MGRMIGFACLLMLLLATPLLAQRARFEASKLDSPNVPNDLKGRITLTDFSAYHERLDALVGRILWVRKGPDGECPSDGVRSYSALDLGVEQFLKTGESLKVEKIPLMRYQAKSPVNFSRGCLVHS